MAFRTVAVVGVGLIGGSFALALRKAGFEGRIVGVSSPATLEKARARGVIDAGASLEEALPQADLIYLAQPILRILEQLPDVARLAGPGALVTDAGSTKAAIVEKAQAVFEGDAHFIGGHPMAGKEGRGVEIAEAALFEGAPYVLTPAEPAELELAPAREFQSWLRRIGSRTLVRTAADHDRTVAYTSHLPQLLSTALAETVGRQVRDENLPVAGGGLRDMSRLAGSSYEIWEGIFLTNPVLIRDALNELAGALEQIQRTLEERALSERFTRAQSLYKKIRQE